MFTQTHQPGETMTSRRIIAWWLFGAVATAIGVSLNLAAGRMPGSEAFGAEDVVDAVGGVAIGGLGVLLLLHGVAAGLGVRCSRARFCMAGSGSPVASPTRSHTVNLTRRGRRER